MEATNGRRRRFEMPVGTPQGGALGPTLWREYTNDLPESIKGATKDVGGGADRNTRDEREATVERTEWTVSEWIDTKTHQGPPKANQGNSRKRTKGRKGRP